MSCPTSPKCIAKLLLRVGFGLALLLVGVAHFQTFSGFQGMVADGLGPLKPLGSLWAYILPLLMIVGGGLIVAGKKSDIATWCAGIALVSIVVGMLLKTVIGGVPLEQMMATVHNTYLWLLIYLIVVKCCLSCEECETGGGGMGGEQM